MKKGAASAAVSRDGGLLKSVSVFMAVLQTYPASTRLNSAAYVSLSPLPAMWQANSAARAG
jgi:hypothetical protein